MEGRTGGEGPLGAGGVGGPGTGRPRLLVVVAHPDDESFGCGSLIALAAGGGAAVTVCCATRGEAGEPAPGSGVDADALPAVREQELRDAADLLGASEVVLLDFVDSGMAGEVDGTTLWERRSRTSWAR